MLDLFEKPTAVSVKDAGAPLATEGSPRLTRCFFLCRAGDRGVQYFFFLFNALLYYCMLYFLARRSKPSPSGNDALENQYLLNGIVNMLKPLLQSL